MSSATISSTRNKGRRVSFHQVHMKPSRSSRSSAGRASTKALPPSSLGSKVNLYSNKTSGDDLEDCSGLPFPDTKQLGYVCLTIVTCLIATFVAVFFANDAVMKQRDPEWRDYKYTSPSSTAQAMDEQRSRPFAGTSIEAVLAPEQFHVYVAIFYALTIIQAGLGFELLVWISFLKKGWSKHTEKLWHFAQFCFPLINSAAMGMSLHQDFACMVLLVPGLWKFGLPETFLYFMSAIYSPNSRSAPRVADFLNGWGTALHHSAVSMFVAVFMTGVAPSTPASLSCALPTLVQHWFAMLHYVSPKLYMVIELSLEVWFEWTVFSTYQELAELHWVLPLVSGCMLVAHWMYLSAAAIELVMGHPKEDDLMEVSSRWKHAVAKSEPDEESEHEEMDEVIDFEVPELAPFHFHGSSEFQAPESPQGSTSTDDVFSDSSSGFKGVSDCPCIEV